MRSPSHPPSNPNCQSSARRWFGLAAEQGDAEAQYNLGVMYQNAEGVTRDDAEAVRWLRLAAEQEHS
ncbi:tetratricopeptide repeat protein, partial [Henriciella sp.]|uniref:tetratricopeptide repeat protein n=1 Tax=Henriciella sp. TaxID=1968823 RepID=UPI003C783523